MRDVRAVSRAVGRRTTLRYLAIGVGASLLAACKGNDKGNDKGKGGADDGSSGGGGGQASPTVTTGPTGRALAAFVRGKWKITSEMPGRETFTYAATVDDGVWTLDFGGGKTSNGTWALQGGRLALKVPEDLGSADSDELTDAAAENVPASVGDSASLFLPWQPPGHPDTSDGQRLDVNYSGKGGVLRIRHIEASGSMTVHTCARA